MKHYLIEITYRVPVDQLGESRLEHRRYLQEHGYDRGMLLFSGPLVPATGGLEIARAGSRAEVDAFISQDPFSLKGLADYRVIEFEPVLRQPWMMEWIMGMKS